MVGLDRGDHTVRESGGAVKLHKWVSLHAPQLPETRHLLNDRRLALLRDGAVVINTARGALIDTRH